MLSFGMLLCRYLMRQTILNFNQLFFNFHLSLESTSKRCKHRMYVFTYILLIYLMSSDL